MSALALPSRLLMGPGPSNVHPRVREALAAPVLGHLDPLVLAMLGEIQERLRGQFGTANPLTLAVSGTGSAGIESCLQGLVEPGDRVVVEVRGFFGARMAEMAARAGGDVTRVETPWGRPADLERLQATCRAVRPRVLAAVHAETSTGVGLALGDVAAIARETDAELVIDCVTSLGGMPVEIDRHGIAAAASCTQKCLGAPPGLAPVSVSPRAEARLAARRHAPPFYLDLPLVARYWGGDHAYHHTIAVNLIYALREALTIAAEEGAAARHARHERHGVALAAGLEALGLEILAPTVHRLPMLTAVRVPPHVSDEAAIRRHLLTAFNLEIGGGLGELKGKIWRIGLMGETSRMSHVVMLLTALGQVLGVAPDGIGAAIGAAGSRVEGPSMEGAARRGA
jgi:alanine-glyoxylate transaminase/serine-glyoxylate transaminase/serine-pyruvate transaminase